MATQGYYAHTAPGSTIGAEGDYLCNHDPGAICPVSASSPIWPQENIAADAANQVAAEDAYISEGPGGGTSTTSCRRRISSSVSVKR